MVRDYEAVYRRLIRARDSTAVLASPPVDVLAGFTATSGSDNTDRNGNGAQSSPPRAGSR
jgi:hypothetical protein